MGVYIPKMEMPNNCGECQFICKESTCRYGKGYERSDFCPLIEVKPHGRLIDADEFYKDINESILLTDGFKDAFNLWFDEQSTIIEAEGEDG